MSHTNSTTNYGLPQFITTDKPFWLTDINGAFSDIDTAINTAKTTADTADTNASQAILDAAAATSAASTADAKGAGAVSSFAPAYDSTSTYALGDMVVYNNLLYKNIVAITTPEAWDGTHWTRDTLSGEVTDIHTELNSLEPTITYIGSSADYTVANNDNPVTIYEATVNKGYYLMTFESIWKVTGSARTLYTSLLINNTEVSADIESTTGWCIQQISVPVHVTADSTNLKVNVSNHHDNTSSYTAALMRGTIMKIHP